MRDVPSIPRDAATRDVETLPGWPSPPADPGARPALEAVTTVAAPLLAGFSITLAAVVVTDSDKVRWPGVVLVFAVGAAAFLVTTVQFGAWARQHNTTPADYQMWFDDADSSEGRRYYVDEMRRQDRVYAVHARRARMAYRLGIVILLAALGFAVLPLTDAAQEEARWAAAALAWVAGLSELVWSWLVRLGRANRSTWKWLARASEWIAPRA